MNKVFNLKTYEEILINARNNGYKFNSFNNLDNFDNNNNPKNEILLRHDIDVCPKAAYIMSKIENRNNIKATYFFMIRSPLYNLFSRSTNYYIKQIINLGHDIGLHFDAGFYKKEGYEDVLSNQIIHQKDIIENEFNIKIKSVSFHQPNKIILESQFKFPKSLINTYSNSLSKKYKYFSDTNQEIRWLQNREISIEDSLSSRYPESIQLLVHPIWWIYGESTPEETWSNALKNIFIQSQEQLVECERVFGKARVIKVIQEK